MKGSSVPEDYELIVAIQSGDTAAFQAIYRKYWRQLFNFASQAVRDTDDAKDLIQDLFTDLWQNRSAIRPETFSTAYLYAALRHKLLDRIRKQTVRQDYARLIAATTTGLDNTTESAVLTSDFTEHLQEGMNLLPDRCRLIFQLSRFDNQSVEEIADQLQLSPQTVKNQLSKALQLLRANLHEYAVSLITLSISLLS
ncbi:RNA polymerase sigma-70 factor [Spirosoma soli]|uniref:RNA polymerase sigma-70 factor n=1 Tax=Spirosoma soli TaxID=1770529 RepID=A0ABW5M3I7_9BACT